MSKSQVIYLHVWTGAAHQARAVVERHFPGAAIAELSHQELRAGGWKGQLRGLRKLRGKALVVFFESLKEAPQLQLVIWSGLIHRCKQTVIADGLGNCQTYRRWDWTWLFPKLLISAFLDASTLLISLLLLGLWKARARPLPLSRESGESSLVAYVFPYPLVKQVAGGAMSHIRGVLGGIADNGAACEIFSGTPLPVEAFPIHEIPARRKFFLFWETNMLSYSVRFAWQVRRMLGKCRPTLVYQRHGRFTVAGALLSRWINAPLVLEYNASELWMADYWDPTRFRTWLRLCEEVSVRCASLIVVVSDPIRNELLQRGIPEHRILVNPNAVDPDHFRPGCGGEQVRQQLGIGHDEIVVGFVGSFSYWHGIPILQQAIREMFRGAAENKTKVLLVGTGPLQAEMRTYLQDQEESKRVIFTGMVPHHQVAAYLDAADILLSPHVRLPDNRPFFGSPTKLFEYMAMGKAIVASRLDQLAEVLHHNDTALLVSPGDVQQLVGAIRLLSRDEDLRQRLGRRAREVAIAQHTWRQNATRVLALT
ncbi:MAG TPA: glycosyltransferase family 4 protein [Terriglobales bacterium]|nr:glycosyltransferase family 4 protein [Terriglobales bacterium]